MLMLVFFSPSAFSIWRPPKTSIWLNVIDETTNSTVSVTTIKIVETYNHTTTGEWEFTVKPPTEIPFDFYPNTTLNILVHPEGYEDQQYSFNVGPEVPEEGVVLNYTFYVKPLQNVKVNLEVKNPLGYPIKEANVSVFAIYYNETFSGTTDANGIFTFFTRFENFKVNVYTEGYEPYESKLTVFHNASEFDYEIMMHYLLGTASKIAIKAVDKNFNPIPQVIVTLTSEKNKVSKITNEDGEVMFEVSCGNYTIEVSREGYQTYRDVLDLSKPLILSKTVQLSEAEVKSFWQQYWYALVLIIAISAIASLLYLGKLKSRRKRE
jgi:hypothetical protein